MRQVVLQMLLVGSLKKKVREPEMLAFWQVWQFDREGPVQVRQPLVHWVQ